MMSEAHSQMMYYLIGFIVVLFSVIVGTLVFSQLKKKKPTSLPQQLTQNEEKTLAEQMASLKAESQLEKVKTPAKAFEPVITPEVSEEKEVVLSQALAATEAHLFGRIKNLFSKAPKADQLEEIEEILYTSDLGPQTVQRLMGALNENLKKSDFSDFQKVREALTAEITSIFSALPKSDFFDRLESSSQKPFVLMVVGVNGAGKTTSIGKLSAHFAQKGKKVLVAAGDTFRAAAGGQLKVWTDRAQVEIFSPDGVTDPSAVAFDAISKAKAGNYDLVIIDTAGRLHTQSNLMEELKKMKRVMAKVVPEAPHETLIVLDANSGQNALMQAKEFHQALQLSGAVLTKMDGTAKGGVAVGLAQELKLPVQLIGVGERIQDLRVFDSADYIRSIVGK